MINIKVAHRLPWRIRLKVPSLIGERDIAQRVADALTQSREISTVDVRPLSGSVIIYHKEGFLDLESVRAILDKEIALVQKGKTGHEVSSCRRSLPGSTNDTSHVPGWVLAVSGIYLSIIWISRLISGKSALPRAFFLRRVFNFPALVAIGLSLPILREGLKTFFERGRLSMDLLITGASYFSILMGEPLTAIVVLWLVNLSEWLEEKTQERTRKAIREMLHQEVREVWVLRDEVEIQMKASDLSKGDILSLRLGNAVPADGTVEEGDALVNESSMTGESLPVFKTAGDKILAGTTIELGHIFVRVDSVGEETRLAGIIRLIEDGEATKAPIQLAAERFSDAVVPFSLSLALVVFFFTRSLQRAMAMLIIACPCGIALSTPTAMTAALGNAARRGIFIKGGSHLEAAGRVNTLVFDKTGTLTSGTPRVSRVVTLDIGYEPIKILQLAASSQIHWKHPMSIAVLEKVREIEIEIPPHEETELIIGHGVRAKIDGNEILVGSHHFMEDYEVDHKSGHEEEKRILKIGESVLFVASNRKIIGLIGIKDRLKENTAVALHALKSLGVRHIAMLTGDHKLNAMAIAKGLPIDEVKWAQSPEDKAEWIARWKEKQADRLVAMVGDGINDTPAFSHADLSFAMGDTGADVAIEHANIVLRKGDLGQVAEAVDLGQNTISTIRQNYSLSVGLNLAGVALAAMGWLSPFLGALFHNLITVGVVSNSAKLLFYHTEITSLAKMGGSGDKEEAV